ncbi:Gamma-tubulin complex component 5 [Gaertneriomyces sp. JEL0708]|nr:Gamma-tubulin complex component 5 [Gaertneriomyces sp. JEL0708]
MTVTAVHEQQRHRLSKLVELITGFERSSTYSPLCLQFAQKELKQHRFPSTDERALLRRLSGLAEKLYISGQEKISYALENAVADAINVPPNRVYNVFDVLRLLLHLASPTTTYDRENRRPKEPNERALTWENILADEPLEGEHWEGMVVQTDDEETDGDTLVQSSPIAEQSYLSNTDEVVQRYTLEEGSPTFSNSQRNTLLNAMKSGAYWVHNSHKSVNNTNNVEYIPYDPCSLAPFIAFFRCNDRESYYYHIASIKYVHETVMIREVLFMLAGAPTFMFVEGPKISLKPTMEYTLMHLSTTGLQNILGWFTEHGSSVRRVRRFAERCCTGASIPTLEAFGSGLAAIVAEFDSHMASLQTYYQSHSRRMPRSGEQEVASLLRLQSELKQKLDLFTTLDVLVSEVSIDDTSHAAGVATNILNSISRRLQQLEFARLEYEVTTVSALLLHTLRPYLDAVDRWIYSGTLDDPSHELFVERADFADMWTEGIAIREHKPTFFNQLSDHIAVAGKSLKMLENIQGRTVSRWPVAELVTPLITQLKVSHRWNTSSSLYVAVVDSFLKKMDILGVDPTTGWAEKLGVASFAPKNDVQGLFPRAFSSVLKWPPQSAAPSVPGRSRTLLQISFDNEETYLRPAQGCLQEAVASIVIPHARRVGEELKSVLLKDCRLMHHLKALQAVYLMTAGSVMHHFCRAIFPKIKSQEVRYHPQYLNRAFVDAIESNHGSHYGIDLTRFSISLTQPESLPSTPSCLDIIDRIHIHYDIPSPLNNIVPSDAILCYNRILRVLLKIQWARHCLENESFRSTRSSCATRVENRALERSRAVARTRLMHFTYSLHAFAGEVIHVECIKLLQDVRAAEGMDALIAAQASFLNVIEDRCLLNGRAASIWKHVYAPLELSAEYASLCKAYHRDVEGIGDERREGKRERLMKERDAAFACQLRTIAERADDLIRFVSDAVAGLASHGVPHVDALAMLLSRK